MKAQSTEKLGRGGAGSCQPLSEGFGGARRSCLLSNSFLMPLPIDSPKASPRGCSWMWLASLGGLNLS